MSGSDSFFAAAKNRRSIYALEGSSPISDERIKHIVEQAVLHSPSSFNSQTSRVLILLGDEHKKLWEEFVKPSVKAVAPPEAWPNSEKRLNGFKNGYGSILLFEDRSVVSGLQEKMPLYADKFPQWSEHAHGILAYVLWTTLEQEGLGANLQHYNPLIDAQVQKEWGVPENWALKAQLVIGKPTAPAGEKSYQPLEDRIKAFGGNLSK